MNADGHRSDSIKRKNKKSKEVQVNYSFTTDLFFPENLIRVYSRPSAVLLLIIHGSLLKSLNLHRKINFYRNIKRKGCCTEGGAGVFAALAEDFDEEFGGSVDDLRVAEEIGV